MDFVELIWGTDDPNTLFRAIVSAISPRGVDVP
jgi:hypothetical protein